MSVAEKDRFKETAIGWIPATWDCVSQSEVVTFHNGRAYKLTEWEAEGTPVIRLQNLTGSGETYYYSNLKLPPHQYVNKDDLLFMWSATFGPHIWRGEKAIYHYHIWKIDCSERVDRSYMFYSLSRFTEEMKNKTNGSTMLHLTKAGMEKESIALPPLPEQRKIAAILTAVDDKLGVIARQIETTQALKQGLMQNLFSQGVGIQDAAGRWVPHVEFKDSPIGKIPQNWDSKTLEDLSIENITYGVVQPGENLVGGVPLIRGGDIKGGNISRKLRTVSVEISNQFKRTVLCGGELLVSLVGYPGETAVVPDDLAGANIARQAGMVRTSSRAMSEFVHCYLASPTGKGCLLGGMIGSAQQVINLKSLREVYVPMPPESEWMQITSVCQSIFAKLDALEKKQAYYRTLKRGLMQKLLTGEWRVNLESSPRTA